MESKLLKLNMLERLNCIGKSRAKKKAARRLGAFYSTKNVYWEFMSTSLRVWKNSKDFVAIIFPMHWFQPNRMLFRSHESAKMKKVRLESLGDLFRVTVIATPKFTLKTRRETSLNFYNSFFSFSLVTYHRHGQLFNYKYSRKRFYASQCWVGKIDGMFGFVNLFILYQLERCALRVLDRTQSRIKNQEQEEIGQSRRISYQAAIMTMESIRVIRVQHLNVKHNLHVVGILLQLPIMPSLLRVLLQATLLVDNLIPPLNLDEGIRPMLLRLQQRIPMPLLLPRTGLWRKEVLDDLALEPDLPNPNPPNQQQLIIHPERTKAEPFLLTWKEMIWYLS